MSEGWSKEDGFSAYSVKYHWQCAPTQIRSALRGSQDSPFRILRKLKCQACRRAPSSSQLRTSCNRDFAEAATTTLSSRSTTSLTHIDMFATRSVFALAKRVPARAVQLAPRTFSSATQRCMSTIPEMFAQAVQITTMRNGTSRELELN